MLEISPGPEDTMKRNGLRSESARRSKKRQKKEDVSCCRTHGRSIEFGDYAFGIL